MIDQRDFLKLAFLRSKLSLSRKRLCRFKIYLQFPHVEKGSFGPKRDRPLYIKMYQILLLWVWKRFFKSDFLKTQLPYTFPQAANERLVYFYQRIILNFVNWPKGFFIHFSWKIVGWWDDVCGFSLFKTFTLYTQTLICIFFILFHTFPNLHILRTLLHIS